MKAYGSDQAFRLARPAIQVYGGAGYLKDYPVEQYCRDAKIFSIYEGTNHIQAMDLVGRKLGQAGGAQLPGVPGRTWPASSRRTGATPTLRQGGGAARRPAQEALMSSAMTLLGWSQAGTGSGSSRCRPTAS